MSVSPGTVPAYGAEYVVTGTGFKVGIPVNYVIPASGTPVPLAASENARSIVTSNAPM